MQDFLLNIAEKYSLDDISNLEFMLKNLKEQKQKELEISPSIEKFYWDYKCYIESTFSVKYLSSVKSSFIHLQNYFGVHFKLRAIGSHDVEKFKTYLMGKAPKGFTVYFKTLKAAFYKAMEWGYIVENPFARIKLKKKQNSRPLYIVTEDLRKVLSNILHPTLKGIVTFAFFTGCRLSEIINLRWKQIDLEKNLITIGGENFQTKNYKTRSIPIANEVRILLVSMNKDNKKPDDFVFSKPTGSAYNQDYVSSKFKEASLAAGMEESIHFHSLRHSFASNLANQNVPIVVLKELMGHSDISTTQIYSHTNLESLQSAIMKFNVQNN